MTPLTEALVLGQLCLLVVVVAAAWRRRFPAAFLAYLLFQAGYLGLIFAAEHLITWNAWLLKEAAQAGIKLWLLAALGRDVLGGYPRAHARFRWRAGVILVVMAGLAIGTAAFFPDRRLIAVVAPMFVWIMYGTTAAFGLLLASCLWHLIPIEPLRKAILLGLSAYLLVYCFTTYVITQAWYASDAAGYVHNAVYLMMLVYWAFAAWDRERHHALLTPSIT